MLLLWRSQYRFLLRHPLLAMLTMLGIALGVAVIHATDIANHSANASLAQAHRELHGFAHYRLIGSGRPVADTDYAELRKRWLTEHPGWRLLSVINGRVQIHGEPWQLLGIDPIADPRLASLDNGNNTRPENTGGRPTGLIGADTALLSQKAARELQADRKTGLPIEVAGGTRTLRILGTYADDQGLFSRLLITDIGTAQNLLGLQGQLSYLELAGSGELPATELEALRRELPPGLQLLNNENLLSGQNSLLEAFQFNLSALSTLALLVGCLLMFSAAQFSFWQRRSLLEHLYWLGVGRRQLLLNLLLEALLIAFCACAIGWSLGALLSRLLLPVAAGTVNALFTTQNIVHFGGAVSDYAKTAALAGSAMLGAQLFLFAGWKRDTAAGQPTRAPSRYRYLLLALMLAGLATALLLAPGDSLYAGFGALFALSGAWLLLAPEIYRGALAVLDRLRLSPLATIALRDSRRFYRRLALALAALCLALAAGLGIDLMVNSFRHSLLGWLDQQIAADFYVGADPANPDALIDELRGDTRIAALSLSRRTTLMVDDTPITVQAVSLPPQAQKRYPLLATAEKDVWQALRKDALIVSEPLARKWRLVPGGTLILPTPQGPRVFFIAAINRDYNTEFGRVVLSLETYRRLWHDNTIDSIGVFARVGTDIQSMQQTLSAAGHPVNDARALKNEITRLFDRTFVITRVLQLLVSTVALAALVSTLLIHQLMQRRQHATLRALGLTQRGLLRLLLLQALPLGLAAGILALPLGYALAWLLVAEINPRAFGWSLDFHANISSAFFTVTLALVLSMIAALYPAWRGARAPIVGDLSRE